MAAGTVFTGTQKAGWFCVGMLLGIPGIIIASLANVNHPDRSKATMMAAIGVGAMVALTVAISLIFSFTLLYILTIAISVAG